jgi:hypothetical protein
VQLRQTDFGLDTVIEEIPNSTQGLPTHINSMKVTLFGNPPGASKPFARNPTSCSEATTRFTADPYGSDTDSTGEASFTPTGCDQVPFSPAFSARVGAPGLTAVGTKPPLTTTIEQDSGEAGLRRALVFLPSNISSDLAALENTCTPAQFQASTCPENAVVGTAVARSPLLTAPLTGPLVLVAPPGPGIPTLGLDLKGQLPLKLIGTFVLTTGTGLQFDGLPDIPISRFALSFSPNRLVINPTNLCDGDARVFRTTFDGHNGAEQSGDFAAAIEGCSGVAGGAPGQAAKKKCKRAKGKRKAGKSGGDAVASKKKKRKRCKRKRKKR